MVRTLPGAPGQVPGEQEQRQESLCRSLFIPEGMSDSWGSKGATGPGGSLLVFVVCCVSCD